MRIRVGLLLLLTVGCSTPSRWGAADVTFDGTTLGDGGTAHPHVTCEGLARPDVVVPLDRFLAAYGRDWYPNVSEREPQARMRLELRYGGDPPAWVEFSLGSAVYRSNDDTVMSVDAGWSGHATFSDLPLVSGEGYGGRDAIRLLDIAWSCSVKN